jgi:glycosyltransferase involved in cell wall biosynthesis
MISIIIPCKNRLNHLSSTYTLTRKLQGDYEVIIVDYNCPMGTADHFINSFKDSKLKVVRADVGPKEWNLSHARNIGYGHSTGDALLFADADTMMKPNFLSAHPLKQGEFYSGSWLHASGVCMVWRTDFERVAGYNECVDGWGSEDFDLYRRLVGIGLRQVNFNEKLFRNMPHHDKIRNEYYGGKNIHLTNEQNYQRTQKEFKSSLIEVMK